MKIIEKFIAKSKNPNEEGPVCIAFLGDSVTQGCFDVYPISETAIETYFDAEHAYHTSFRKILNMLYPNVPINIINAGISGGSAPQGLERLERDVLRFSPDLCVVCFGLNDSGVNPDSPDSLDQYLSAVQSIFEELIKNDIEVIFMTPNTMCTEVSCHISSELIKNIAERKAKVQNSGRLEMFVEAAKKLAFSMNIPVCDCYIKWKKLQECGVNTTELLSNKINHPIKEMNQLFAYSLAETIFFS